MRWKKNPKMDQSIGNRCSRCRLLDGGACAGRRFRRAGRTLTVNQAVAPCSYRVSPLEVKVDEDRHVARIQVETASTCSWTAVSNTPWISVVNNASGTGSGEVWISIGENDGKNRNGTVTVAGQTVQVQHKDK